MKMIDLVNIDIVAVDDGEVEIAAVNVAGDISKLPMSKYMVVLEEAIAATSYNSKTVCFEVNFEKKLGNKDMTHFSELISNLIFYSFTGFDRRDREARLSAPISGNVSEMAMKKAINYNTKADRVNVVCRSGNKVRRIV